MARRRARKNPIGIDDVALALAGAALLGAGVYAVSKPSSAATSGAPAAATGGCNQAAIMVSCLNLSTGNPTATDVANLNTLTAACANAMPASLRTMLLGQLATAVARLPSLTGGPAGATAAVVSAISTLQSASGTPGAAANPPATGAGRPGSMLIAGPRGEL